MWADCVARNIRKRWGLQLSLTVTTQLLQKKPKLFKIGKNDKRITAGIHHHYHQRQHNSGGITKNSHSQRKMSQIDSNLIDYDLLPASSEGCHPCWSKNRRISESGKKIRAFFGETGGQISEIDKIHSRNEKEPKTTIVDCDHILYPTNWGTYLMRKAIPPIVRIRIIIDCRRKFVLPRPAFPRPVCDQFGENSRGRGCKYTYLSFYRKTRNWVRTYV